MYGVLLFYCSVNDYRLYSLLRKFTASGNTASGSCKIKVDLRGTNKLLHTELVLTNYNYIFEFVHEPNYIY
jgi:hypothetical protein